MSLFGKFINLMWPTLDIRKITIWCITFFVKFLLVTDMTDITDSNRYTVSNRYNR